MQFVPRLDTTNFPNQYYIHTSKGGLNECIIIDEATGLVVPNCVGYSWGRWYECTLSRPNLCKLNADQWFGYTQDGYVRKQANPRVGDVICWSGGSGTGLGHVANVEIVEANGDILTSNSAYGGVRFFLERLTAESNYQRPYSGYTFQGFIENPIFTPTPPFSPNKIPLIYYIRYPF